MLWLYYHHWTALQGPVSLSMAPPSHLSVSVFKTSQHPLFQPANVPGEVLKYFELQMSLNKRYGMAGRLIACHILPRLGSLCMRFRELWAKEGGGGVGDWLMIAMEEY